jgi:hypothetical protein
MDVDIEAYLLCPPPHSRVTPLRDLAIKERIEHMQLDARLPVLAQLLVRTLLQQGAVKVDNLVVEPLCATQAIERGVSDDLARDTGRKSAVLKRRIGLVSKYQYKTRSCPAALKDIQLRLARQ